MKRRAFITLLSGAAAWPIAARAQRPAMPVIGILSPIGPTIPPNDSFSAAFHKGLNELAYVEGRNVARFAPQPSPNSHASVKSRRGAVAWAIRDFTFEACSDFTHVTARWIARPPKAAFVTRLRPAQLPKRAARQLPDQSTTLWVEPSSTGDTRRRGALHNPG